MTTVDHHQTEPLQLIIEQMLGMHASSLLMLLLLMCKGSTATPNR